MSRSRLLFLIFGVALLFGSLGFWWSQHPSFVLFQSARCFISKDRPCFEHYVDVPAVSRGLADDFERLVLNSLGVDTKEAGFNGTLAQMLISGLRVEGEKVVQRQMDAYFGSQVSEGTAGTTAALNGAVMFYLTQRSDFSVDWKLNVQITDNLSMMTFFVQHLPTSKRFPVRVKAEKVNGAWRITRVYDLLENYIPFETK